MFLMLHVGNFRIEGSSVPRSEGGSCQFHLFDFGASPHFKVTRSVDYAGLRT